MYLQKGISIKTFGLHLKVTDEKSRILSRIRIKMSRIRNTGFYIYKYSLVPEAWDPLWMEEADQQKSLFWLLCLTIFSDACSMSSFDNGGSWQAEISTLASLFIYILWCLKHELLLWVKEAIYTNTYSGSISVPDPDPSINKQNKMKKNLDLYCFVTSLWLIIFEEWCKCSNVPSKRNKHKNFLFAS